jgi:4-carboxymuconolactone decarboxylase
MGGAEPQLEYHLGIALDIGVPPDQVVETVLFLSPFIGFARTLNAMRSIKRVFAARGLLSK